MVSWFDAFRSNLGPTWYGENRTAVVTDTRTLGIAFVFTVLFSAFLLVFPGVRRQVRVPSPRHLISITPSPTHPIPRN